MSAAVKLSRDLRYIQSGFGTQAQFNMVFFVHQHQRGFRVFLPANVINKIAVVYFQTGRNERENQPSAAMTFRRAERLSKIDNFPVR